MNNINIISSKWLFFVSFIAILMASCGEDLEVLTKDYEPKDPEPPGGGVSIDIDVSSDAVGKIPDGFWQLIPELTSEFEEDLDPILWTTDRFGKNSLVPVLYTKSNTTTIKGFLRQRTNILVNDISAIPDLGAEIWLGTGITSSSAPLLVPGYYCEIALRPSEISMGSMIEFLDNLTPKFSIQMVGEPSESSKSDFNKKMIVSAGTTTETIELSDSAASKFHVIGIWYKDASNFSIYLDGELETEITASTASGPLTVSVNSQYLKEMGYPTVDQINDLNKSMLYADWIRVYQEGEAIVESKIRNASFETANLADWDTTNAASNAYNSLYTTGVKSGAYCAMLKGVSSISQMVEVEVGVNHVFTYSGFAASGSGSIDIDGASSISLGSELKEATIQFSPTTSPVQVTISSSGEDAMVFVDDLILDKEKPTPVIILATAGGTVSKDTLWLTLNEKDTVTAANDYGYAFEGWYNELNELVSSDYSMEYKLTTPESVTFTAQFVDQATLTLSENYLAACDPGFELRDSVKDRGQNWFLSNETPGVLTTTPQDVHDGFKAYSHLTGNLEIRYNELDGALPITVGKAYVYSFWGKADGDVNGTINYLSGGGTAADFVIPGGNTYSKVVAPFMHSSSNTMRLMATWGAPEYFIDDMALHEGVAIEIEVQGGGTVEGEGAYTFASDITLTATNGSGTFVRYEVNGKEISTSPTFTMTNVRTSYNVVAVFE